MLKQMSVSLALFMPCFHSHSDILVLLIKDPSVDSLLAHEEDQGLGGHASRDRPAVTAFASDIHHVVFIHQQVFTKSHSTFYNLW